MNSHVCKHNLCKKTPDTDNPAFSCGHRNHWSFVLCDFTILAVFGAFLLLAHWVSQPWKIPIGFQQTTNGKLEDEKILSLNPSLYTSSLNYLTNNTDK